jgi:hypothetical protein
VTSSLSPETVLRAAGGQVWCDLGDEVAILHLGSGLYYGLDGVGARVWALLQEPRRVRDLGDVIVREYDVDRPRFERDLPAFLSALEQANLIEVDHASAL